MDSSFLSVFLSLFLSLFFVGSLYIWPNAFTLHRNHPTQIKQRIISLSLVCGLSPILLSALVPNSISVIGIRYSFSSVFKLLGLHFSFDLILLSFLALIPFILLFIGPLVGLYFEGFTLPTWQEISSHIFLRNYFFAPFAEEFIFRGCIAPLIYSSFGFGTTVAVAPLFFGVAHVHHIYQAVTHEKAPWAEAMLSAGFQFLYSTLFGMMTTAVFLRTGLLLPCCFAHSFCNMMGCPDVSDLSGLPYSNILRVAYPLGVLLFALTFGPCTSPPMFHSIFWP